MSSGESEEQYPKIVHQKKENEGEYRRPVPIGSYAEDWGDYSPVPGWKIQNNIYVSKNGFLYVGASFNDEPIAPHTGTIYAFGVRGDILVGDILFIGRNPHQVGIRHVPLAKSTPTNIYSNRHLSSDNYGGASINLYSDEPDSRERGRLDSGYINLVSYGQGTGEKANSIRFLTRDKPNSIAERMIVKGNGKIGIGTNKPEEQLDVMGNVKLGSASEPKGIVLYDEIDGKRHLLKVRNGKMVLKQ